MKELKDTVALMESDDYKDRFKAEYWQTKMRFDALRKTIVKLDAGTLKLNTDIRLLSIYLKSGRKLKKSNFNERI